MKFRIVIDKEREEEIVARVHQRTPLIDELEALVIADGTVGQITGYDENDIKMLDINEVESFYVEGGKTYASYSDKKQYRVKMHLYELEAVLPKEFEKINKSNIANMKQIVRFRTSLNGAVDAEFKSGFSDYISRRCFAELKRRYSL
ncbi:MAG: LytTR family transcriptional regulator [Lachnospiraceae bacterium]|nr:LytTR family transcriptional regulator [Lachnospiraceae bacterium]